MAVTRARSQLHVFASVSADIIDLNRTKALGVRHLKAFLDFAERGPVALPGNDEGSLGPAESPFEEAVAEALRGNGWDVRTQVGVSGFRVDLGVIHPDHAGAYLAGVECDGATYHSSASARDRDRTREAVMRGLGWEVVRIWSTDWFANANESLARVDAALLKLLETSRANAAQMAASAESQRGATSEPDPQATLAVSHQAHDTNIDDQHLAGPEDPPAQPAPIENDTGTQDLIYPMPEQPKPVIAAEARQPLIDQIATDTVPDIPLALDPDKFYDLSYVPTLHALISSIVREEGPLREDLLVRAVARRHGWQRAGRRIRERVIRCIANVETHVEDGNLFYWAPGSIADIVPYRGLKGRSAREIARAEIYGLISTLAHLSHSEDQAKDLSLAMGLSRLTEDTREYLDNCISKYAEIQSASE